VTYLTDGYCPDCEAITECPASLRKSHYWGKQEVMYLGECWLCGGELTRPPLGAMCPNNWPGALLSEVIGEE